MLTDVITLTMDDVATTWDYTQTSIGTGEAIRDRLSAPAGKTDKLTVKQSMVKGKRRRAMVRLDQIQPVSADLPNPSTTSVYVVIDYDTTETDAKTNAGILAYGLGDFLKSSDCSKILNGEY